VTPQNTGARAIYSSNILIYALSDGYLMEIDAGPNDCKAVYGESLQSLVEELKAHIVATRLENR
jgi:hypothetical protein